MASDHEDPDNWSTSHKDDRSDDHGMVESSDDNPNVEEEHHSNTPTIIVSDVVESQKSDSKADGSASLGSHHSDSDVEIVTIWKTPQKKKSTSTNDAADDAPGPSKHEADVDKASESKQWWQGA